MAESITGSSNAFLQLERELAQKIANSLNVAFKPKEVAAGSNIDAALYFSKGVDAFDKGNKTTAQKLFQKCIEVDPSYQKQIENIQGR
jgi:Tfp pilus assembly protein PilF